ncbi:11251_t:CDS:2, partial [Acaulospora morrowiae]
LKCCPNCRKLIKNVYRYGRILKKRILDTQNRKFIVYYDSRLKRKTKNLEKITKRIENNRMEILKNLQIPSWKSKRNPKKSEEEILNPTLPEITSREHFERLEHYYSIPSSNEGSWNKHVASLLDCYTEFSRLMTDTKNPPYKRAYDAAVSCLFKKKSEVNMDVLIEDIRSSEMFLDDSTAAQSRRLQESLEEVGIITPKIDRRFYLDGFFEIVNIQKVLFYEVSSIIDGLTLEHKKLKENWLKFSEFLIQSIKSHLELINKTASENKYTRHSVLALLELSEFECTVERFELKNPPSGSITPLMKERIKDKCNDIERCCLQVRNLLHKMDMNYFKQRCNDRIEKILKDVQEIYIAAERSGELTREEKLEIHRAMSGEFVGISGTSHWYQCPNGHVYTVGECGRAMERSTCPDCGATIGGGNHQFDEGNERNMEFDAMQL